MIPIRGKKDFECRTLSNKIERTREYLNEANMERDRDILKLEYCLLQPLIEETHFQLNITEETYRI